MTDSVTSAVLHELTYYARRPFSDELDERPLPDTDALQHGLSDMFDILTGMFADTRLEDDTDDRNYSPPAQRWFWRCNFRR